MEHIEQTKDVCCEIVKGVERRLESGNKRMDKHSETIDRLDRLITELAAINKRYDAALQDQDERLKAIEERRGTWWDKVISGIISAAVAAFMALVLRG